MIHDGQNIKEVLILKYYLASENKIISEGELNLKIKSILTFLLALILMVAFSSTAFAAMPSAEAVTTSATKTPNYVSGNPPKPGDTNIMCIVTAQPSLTVRSGPGTSYALLSSLMYGDSVLVLLVNNSGWAEIRIGSNATGWVSTSYLTIQY